MTDLLITQPLSLQGVLSDVMTNSFKRALEKAVQASDPAPLIKALFGGVTFEVMNKILAIVLPTLSATLSASWFG